MQNEQKGIKDNFQNQKYCKCIKLQSITFLRVSLKLYKLQNFGKDCRYSNKYMKNYNFFHKFLPKKSDAKTIPFMCSLPTLTTVPQCFGILNNDKSEGE